MTSFSSHFLLCFGYQNALNLKSKFTYVNINTTYLYFTNESPSRWIYKMSKYAGNRLNGFLLLQLMHALLAFLECNFLTDSGKTWHNTTQHNTYLWTFVLRPKHAICEVFRAMTPCGFVTPRRLIREDLNIDQRRYENIKSLISMSPPFPPFGFYP
jgi:hypothetical protein